MADITKIKDVEVVQATTPSNPTWKLAEAATSTDTSLVVNYEPLDSAWASITKDFFIWIQRSDWYVETCLVTNVSTVTLTVVRWINLWWLNTETWDSDLAVAHEANEEVIFNLPAQLYQQFLSCFLWTIWTWWESFQVWNEANNDIKIVAKNWDANSPFLMYDASENQWVFSNDGLSTTDVWWWTWTITAWDWIDIAAWVVSTDLKANWWLEIDTTELAVTAWDWITVWAWWVAVDLDTDAWLEIDTAKLQVKLDWTTLERSASWLKATSATTAQPWAIEVATDAEVVTGTDTERAVTPAWARKSTWSMIQAPTVAAIDTSTQVTVDSILVIKASSLWSVNILSDAADPPTVNRWTASTTWTSSMTITVPIRKDEYYKVVTWSWWVASWYLYPLWT